MMDDRWYSLEDNKVYTKLRKDDGANEFGGASEE